MDASSEVKIDKRKKANAERLNPIKIELTGEMLKKYGDKGSFYKDPERGNMIYLRWQYRGIPHVKSLKVTAISEAVRLSVAVRNQFDAADDKALLDSPVLVKSKGLTVWDEVYRVKTGDEGYLEKHYSDSDPNTRYDVEKVLKLYFGTYAKIIGKEFKAPEDGKESNPLMFEDIINQDIIEKAYKEVKQNSKSAKVPMKVFWALKKFINWEIEKNRIPKDKKLLQRFVTENSSGRKKKSNKGDLVPSMSIYKKDRKAKIKLEQWFEDEYQKIVKACKEGKPHTRPLDYEIYWLGRNLGIPPSDAYELTENDFPDNPDNNTGLYLIKTRSKEESASYYQPIDKGQSEDAETERIIRERIAMTKKGERLFYQPLKVDRLKKDAPETKTQWVANFSGRRMELQKSLGLPVKGFKGLRATFITYWRNKHCPIDVLEKWVGHAPGSTMIRDFYEPDGTGVNWKPGQAA